MHSNGQAGAEGNPPTLRNQVLDPAINIWTGGWLDCKPPAHENLYGLPA